LKACGDCESWSLLSLSSTDALELSKIDSDGAEYVQFAPPRGNGSKKAFNLQGNLVERVEFELASDIVAFLASDGSSE
jgi:hypothetical protein